MMMFPLFHKQVWLAITDQCTLFVLIGNKIRNTLINII